MEKAILYLREKGIASASKKSGRATKDGRITCYIHPGDKLGVMLEVNCETDFVAKGEQFIEFTRDIAMHIAAAAPSCLFSTSRWSATPSWVVRTATHIAR